MLAFVTLEDADHDIHLPPAVDAEIPGRLPQVRFRNLLCVDPSTNGQLGPAYRFRELGDGIGLRELGVVLVVGPGDFALRASA